MVKKVLFVGHERERIARAAELLEGNGFEVKVCATAEEALEQLGVAGVMIVDEKASSDLVHVAEQPHVEVVLSGDSEVAAGIQAEADTDYLGDPEDPNAVLMRVRHAFRHRDAQAELAELRRVAETIDRFGGLVGASPVMLELYRTIRLAARHDTTVLITGESGTGKELVARELHQRSVRSDAAFVAINCAALPEGLLESELFGHVRGAYTDARQAREGLFVRAGGGTLFLDEVGEMPLGVQAKLLRVLEERTLRPVGSDRETPVNVRIIAATNADLEDAVTHKRFREDLFYRLNVLSIEVPPLRERPTDVVPLAHFFLHHHAVASGSPARSFSHEVLEILQKYEWPGNVRQLRNCVERAVALSETEVVPIAALPKKMRSATSNSQPIPASPLVTLDELEKRYILDVFRRLDKNKRATARTLGIDRKTLYRKLEEFGAYLPADSDGQT